MSITAQAATQPVRARVGAGLHRRFVIGAALCAVVAAVIYLLMVRTSLGHRLDNAALVGSHQHVSWSTRLHDAVFLRHINAANFAVVLAVIVAIGVARRRPWLGLTAAGGALLAAAGTDLLKSVLLGRPNLVTSDIVYPVNTFPSGHTATALGCALALVVVAPPAWRGLAAVAGGLYATITASYVQTAGWHRASDAIGAAFIAFAVMALAIAALARTRRIRTGPRLMHVPALLILGGVWIYGALRSVVNVARVLHYLTGNSSALAPTTVVLNEAYQFSISITIVVVVSLLIALLLMLQDYDLDAPRDRSSAVTADAAPEGAGHAPDARDDSASSSSAGSSSPL
jgi:hypothetical protein